MCAWFNGPINAVVKTRRSFFFSPGRSCSKFGEPSFANLQDTCRSALPACLAGCHLTGRFGFARVSPCNPSANGRVQRFQISRLYRCKASVLNIVVFAAAYSGFNGARLLGVGGISIPSACHSLSSGLTCTRPVSIVSADGSQPALVSQPLLLLPSRITILPSGGPLAKLYHYQRQMLRNRWLLAARHRCAAR